jgi:hypothetical protein
MLAALEKSSRDWQGCLLKFSADAQARGSGGLDQSGSEGQSEMWKHFGNQDIFGDIFSRTH